MEHSHFNVSNVTKLGNFSELEDLDFKYNSGAIAMMVVLSAILLLMLVLLLLPKSTQDSVFRCISGQSPDQSFNYIDVGLYKTRHSMYRKEIYSLAMQGNRAKKPKIKDAPIKSQISEKLKEQFNVASANTIHSNKEPGETDKPTTPQAVHNKMNDNRHIQSCRRPDLVVTFVTNEPVQEEILGETSTDPQSSNKVEIVDKQVSVNLLQSTHLPLKSGVYMPEGDENQLLLDYSEDSPPHLCSPIAEPVEVKSVGTQCLFFQPFSGCACWNNNHGQNLFDLYHPLIPDRDRNATCMVTSECSQTSH